MERLLLQFVVWLAVMLWRLLQLLFRGLRSLARRLAARWANRNGSPQPNLRPAPTSLLAAPVSRVAAQSSAVTAGLKRELAVLIAKADEEAARCATEEANERFTDTLSTYVAGQARRAGALLNQGSPNIVPQVQRFLPQLAFVLETVTTMAEQRRDPTRLLLLGDADALAEACYRPLLELGQGSGLRLTSSRAATILGDKDLAIFVGFVPTGLAPIILPSAWATEIGWWPALGHEIGHDFYASVQGFSAEMRTTCGLDGKGGLARPLAAITLTDVEAAYACWGEELFADVFGTLMLGAAYVTTMIWIFANPKTPESVTAIRPVAVDQSFSTYEEHPPAHLRVVLMCWLLGEIGFPTEAAVLEKEWRTKHGNPETLLVPTEARVWYRVDEDPYIARGRELVSTLYLSPFTTLAGRALRSIPGLDLGPREHQAALDARDSFLAGRESRTRDPRSLIAGAVLAWKERPALAARVLEAARATVPAVGVSRRQLRLREARETSAIAGADGSELGLSAWRDAFAFGEVIRPPRASRLSRRL